MTAFRDRLIELARGRSSIETVVSAATSEIVVSGADEQTLLLSLETAEITSALDTRQRAMIADHIRATAASVRDKHQRDGESDDRTVLLPPVAAVQVGSVIKDRFELVKLLGEGGMGKVFKAIDRVRRESGDRHPFVALKVLGQAFSRLEISTIALQREARKALSLTHANIVRVYDFDRDGSMVFMTMELLSGHSLETVVRASGFRGLPLDRALPIIRSAAAALAYAHESGLVHSDFKPSNVFLTDRGQADRSQVKVIDFGISRTLKSREAGGDQTLFDPGTLRALTLPYASPEQIEGQDPDARDDVYALACVTYELLTGRHPFERMSSVKAMTQGKQPARIEGLERRQWEALKRALAFQRSVRTPTVTQFIEQFAPFSGGRRPMLLAASGAAGLVAAAGLAAWLFWPTPGVEEARVQQPPVRQVASVSDIRRIVRAPPCSLLQAETRDGVVHVDGMGNSAAQLDSLSRQLTELPGVADVRQTAGALDEAFCQPVEMIRPFVFAAQDAESPLAIRPTKAEFIAGDPLTVELINDDRDGYVYVDYYQVDGNVVHMLPRPDAGSNYLRAGERLQLGTGGISGEWIVSPPYDRDLVTLIKTAEPLFQSVRKKEVERTADYLPDLLKRLALLAERSLSEPVAGAYAIVWTRAR